MAEKKPEIKITVEREYVVPLRKQWLKVPKYKRTPKAIKAIKQFIAKHMKVEERDVKKVKINKWLNHELWFRGIKKPPAKIKVKAKKLSNGNVEVELVNIPKVLSFKIKREEKQKLAAEEEKKKKEEEKKKKEEQEKKEQEEKKDDKLEQKLEEKKEERKEGTEKQQTEEEKKEKKEKQEAVVEAGLKQAEKEAKQRKHEVGGKTTQPKHQFRKALKK